MNYSGKNFDAFRKFELQLANESPLNPGENLQRFEWMAEEAFSLGVLPKQNPLDGFEEKIYFIKRLQSVSGPHTKDNKNAL